MMKKKWILFWNYCIPKGKNGGHIIGKFYVGHFLCVNDNKKSDIWCTSNHALYLVLLQFLWPKNETKEGPNILLLKSWNNLFEKIGCGTIKFFGKCCTFDL
jgi:hypothetical protein